MPTYSEVDTGSRVHAELKTSIQKGMSWPTASCGNIAPEPSSVGVLIRNEGASTVHELNADVNMTRSRSWPQLANALQQVTGTSGLLI